MRAIEFWKTIAVDHAQPAARASVRKTWPTYPAILEVYPDHRREIPEEILNRLL